MMGITKSNQKTAKKEYRWLDRLLNSSFLFLSPYALLFGLLILLPVIVAFLLSFTYFNTVQFPEFIGFQNYIDLIMGDTIFFTKCADEYDFVWCDCWACRLYARFFSRLEYFASYPSNADHLYSDHLLTFDYRLHHDGDSLAGFIQW